MQSHLLFWCSKVVNYVLTYLCLVFVMLSRLLFAALWSPAGKGLTSWLLFVMFNCVFVTFPCGILGQVWYLILSIPDLCRLSYFYIHEYYFYLSKQCSLIIRVSAYACNFSGSLLFIEMQWDKIGLRKMRNFALCSQILLLYLIVDS